MTRYLVLCFLLTTMAGASAADRVPAPDIAALLVKVGLAADDAAPAPAAEAPDMTKLCERVSFSRKLKYGENDQNVLDVATGSKFCNVAIRDTIHPSAGSTTKITR